MEMVRLADGSDAPIMPPSSPPREEVHPRATRLLAPELRAEAEFLRVSGSIRNILFVPGPGDVQGTYRHWRAERDDPIIPGIAYSQQIYEFAAAIGARLSVLQEASGPAGRWTRHVAGPVRFRGIRPVSGKGAGYHLSDMAYGLRVLLEAWRCGADTIILQRMLKHLWILGLARVMGLQLVVLMHNSLWPINRAPTLKERILAVLNRGTLRRAAAVIAISEPVATQIRRSCSGIARRPDVQVPQYALRACPAARSVRARPRAHRLIYVGRIERVKGVFDLLDAFDALAAKIPDLTLEFVGVGHDSTELDARIQANRDRSRLTFSGARGGAEVFELLSTADLLICPTTSGFCEGLAKAPIEAALCGVPSIITDVVPAAELMGPAAAVVPADRPDLLAAMIERVLSSPDRLARMSLATRELRPLVIDRRRSLSSLLLRVARPRNPSGDTRPRSSAQASNSWKNPSPAAPEG
ncbi:MAG: glycosyltransferase family 4 protein [Pseudomonadota bacterium]